MRNHVLTTMLYNLLPGVWFCDSVHKKQRWYIICMVSMLEILQCFNTDMLVTRDPHVNIQVDRGSECGSLVVDVSKARL